MSTSKRFDRVCCVVLALSLLVTVLFMNGTALGIQTAERTSGYEARLFDTTKVHTIDIVMDDWDGFLETCENEEYAACAVVIDGEAYKNVALRAKGNTSLSTVRSMDSQRYSLKIEFDHYESGKTYHGLDKLCLNNIIQDNTYMKDYLTYRMMSAFGADAPLCSYVDITVNGEEWGLYLAVEGLEDSFLRRTYGTGYGDLYKPDSMSFGGGGPGNGKGFNIEDFRRKDDDTEDTESTDTASAQSTGGMPSGMPNMGGGMPDMSSGSPGMPGGGMPGMPGGGQFNPFGGTGSDGQFNPFGGTGSDGSSRRSRRGGGSSPFDFGGMGGTDVKLQYSDDDPDSYSNIFNNAKTDVTYGDKMRLISSLKKLGEREDLESVLDIDEVLRYFVVHNYVVNGDSYTGNMIHNYYLYEDGGKLSMIPWDYNLAFGCFQGNDSTGSVNDPIDSPLSVSGDGTRPMADWYLQGDEWTELYHQYFAEFLDTVDVQGIIQEARALIASYVEKDTAEGTAFCTYEEFEKGADTLATFCALRTESVRGQLAGTIPATDDGQDADDSALIDASGITVSDMGSMGGGMGGRGGGPGGGSRSSSGSGDSGAPGSDGTGFPGSSGGFPAFGGNSGSDGFPAFGGNFDSSGGFPDFGGFSGPFGGSTDSGGGFPSMPGDFQPEQMRFSGGGTEYDTQTLLLTGISAAVLIAVLLLVRKPWKRY